MKKIKKVVDERQELELLKIEHVGFWIMFWGLCISIIVQAMFMESSFREFGAEFIIFMISCIIFLIGCIKKGQWDYYTKPCMKTYLMTSIIGTASFSIIFAISNYIKYKTRVLFLIEITLIFAAFIFALLFITMVITGKLTINQRKKLEQEFNDEEKIKDK